MKDFHAGQKVVCINGKFDDHIKALYKALPVEGKTYVVRDVLLGVNISTRGKRGTIRLLLIGLVNDLANAAVKSSERGFDSDRFRPLDEVKATAKKKDIMLVGSRSPEVFVPKELAEV